MLALAAVKPRWGKIVQQEVHGREFWMVTVGMVLDYGVFLRQDGGENSLWAGLLITMEPGGVCFCHLVS